MFFRLNLSGQGCPMRYLELAELSQLNTLLADIQSDDGGKIFGRVECYSCTLTGKGSHYLSLSRQGCWTGQEATPKAGQEISRGHQ